MTFECTIQVQYVVTFLSLSLSDLIAAAWFADGLEVVCEESVGLVVGEPGHQKASMEGRGQGAGAAWAGRGEDCGRGKHLAIQQVIKVATLLLHKFIVANQQEQNLE